MQTQVNGKEPATKKKVAAPKKVAPKKAASTATEPKKKKAAAPAPAPKKKAAEKAVKEKAARSPKEDGVKYRIKKMMVKDPNISPDDIAAQLKKDGDKQVSKFTVAAIRAEFRHSLQVLRDLGWPKVSI